MSKQPNKIKIAIGNGMSIYVRGKRGIYVADYWHDGKHSRTSLKTANKRIALQRAQRLAVQLEDGTFSPATARRASVSVNQAVTEFVAYLRTENRRRKTIVKYEGLLLRKFIPYLNANGITEVSDITLRQIDGYRNEQKPKLSLKSMANEGVALKGWLKWCEDRELIHKNPLAKTFFKKPKPKRLGGPNMDQINQILVKSSPIRVAPLAVLAFTGMRAGECQHLRREDVDLENNWIYIESRAGAETKTGESRKVPIHPRLRGILQGVRKSKGPWFFCAQPSRKYPQGGQPLNMKHICEDFKKVLQGLGIAVGKANSGYTLHSLRSSFKIICLHAGIPREVVDEWQGHAGQRNAASDAYYALKDDESQQFMSKAPFGAAAPSGEDGTKKE